MTERVQIGFEGQAIEMSLDNLLPTRSVQPEFRKTRKFAQIRSSIREIGLIEPLRPGRLGERVVRCRGARDRITGGRDGLVGSRFGACKGECRRAAEHHGIARFNPNERRGSGGTG